MGHVLVGMIAKRFQKIFESRDGRMKMQITSVIENPANNESKIKMVKILDLDVVARSVRKDFL